MIRRRTVLAGAAALAVLPGLRPPRAAPAPADDIVAAAGLGAETGFALADLGTGEIIEAHQPGALRPPGSVAKVVTALWALDALGPGYRFRTELRAAGPVAGGLLAGDLVLAGGGDPLLDTDALGDLVAALRAGGLRAVTGRLLVADGALPAVAEIDPGQPPEAAYNPSIAGTGLNFNRVFLAWAPGEAGPSLAFTAPGARFTAPADGFAAELAAAGLPRHRIEAGREIWTLARGGLGGRGSVWLPVRAPAAYAGAVLARLAADAGIALPTPQVVAAADGGLLAVREGQPLAPMLADMLGFSTNLTAEVVGLRAAQARGAAPDGTAASAAAMSGWAQARFGLAATRLVDHSGLGAASQTTAADLVALLRAGAGLGLPGLLKPRPILDAERRPVELDGVTLRAKSGTLDFASGLAGYLDGRRRLVFAILTADPERRARITPEQRSNPPGAAAWTARARGLQQALLRRWAEAHG